MLFTCESLAHTSRVCTWLLTIVVDILRLRPAAENPPFSATRTNTVRLVRRSIDPGYADCWTMSPLFFR